MRVVWDDKANVAAWVASRIPYMADPENPGQFLTFGECYAVGVVSSNGKALGGVVFHNWQPAYRNIEVSFASDTARWLTRKVISEILSYPFGLIGCERVTTLTPKRNTRARAFLDTFGFKREGVIRKGFGDDDMIVSGLLKREWEASRFNRERAVQSAAPAATFPRAPQIALPA